MIDSFSKKITNLIKESVDGITLEKEEIIDYGIKIVVYEIIIIAFVFSLAIFLGVLKQFFVAFTVYGLLRVVEGGAHMNSRIKCFATYVFLIFGIIYLSKYIRIGIQFSMPIFLISFYTAYVYAPGDTLEKPILRKKDRSRLRIISLIFLETFFIAECIIWYFDKVYFNIILLITIFVSFLLSPIGYKLTGCKRSS